MTDASKKSAWKLKTAIALWLITSTYFAAFEIDDRLAIHYSSKTKQQQMTVNEVEKSIQNTPAGKVLP